MKTTISSLLTTILNFWALWSDISWTKYTKQKMQTVLSVSVNVSDLMCHCVPETWRNVFEMFLCGVWNVSVCLSVSSAGRKMWEKRDRLQCVHGSVLEWNMCVCMCVRCRGRSTVKDWHTPFGHAVYQYGTLTETERNRLRKGDLCVCVCVVERGRRYVCVSDREGMCSVLSVYWETRKGKEEMLCHVCMLAFVNRWNLKWTIRYHLRTSMPVA